METRQFGTQSFERKLGDGEFSGGDIGIRNRRSIQVQNDRSEVVIRVTGQKSRLGHSPRSHHSDDLAFDQSLCRYFADLFTDGNVITFFDQTREIVLYCMVGDSRQRNTHPAANRTRR